MFCQLTGQECAGVSKDDPCPLGVPAPATVPCCYGCAEDWCPEDELDELIEWSRDE